MPTEYQSGDNVIPVTQRIVREACKGCGLWFLPVPWIESRTRGYCCEKCTPEFIRARAERLSGKSNS